MAMRPQTIDDDSTSPPSARAPHTSNFSNPQQSSGMSLEDQVGLLTARLINVETRLRTLTDETYNSFFAVKEDITDARQQATRQISSANDTLHRQAASDKEHHQAEISSVNKRLDDIGPMLNSVDIQEGQNSASIQGLADRLKDYVWRTDRDIDEMEEEFREVYREVDRLGYKVSSLHRPIIKVDDDQIVRVVFVAFHTGWSNGLDDRSQTWKLCPRGFDVRSLICTGHCS